VAERHHGSGNLAWKRRRHNARLLFLGSGAGQGSLQGEGVVARGAGCSCAAGQEAMGRLAGVHVGKRTEG
jgi:hypothetical protein